MYNILCIPCIYSSAESETEPVMKLILDRDEYEYDYDDNYADGKAVVYLVFNLHSLHD